MEKQYVSTYHELEESHWWFLGRRDMLSHIMKNYEKNKAVLEIGCSGGLLLQLLYEQGFNNVEGIDINEAAIEKCKKKGITNVCIADGQKTGFRDRQFDVIIASDVLEHIHDESATLSEWGRILKSGGSLIVFVPAFQFLWSSHDALNHHCRRYTKPAFIDALRENGFTVERSSYWNFCLFFPVAARRSLLRMIHGAQAVKGEKLLKANPLVNRILELVLKTENGFLMKGTNFPAGISLFAIARKI